MEDNNWGYDQSQYDEDRSYDTNNENNKSIGGYRIVIAMMTIVMIAISCLYFNTHRQLAADYELLMIARDSLAVDLSELITDFDELHVTNENMSKVLDEERYRADSIILQLQRERNFSYNKLKQYEKELGTLRSVMKGYLQQIDSLNTLNKQLLDENLGFRKQISEQEDRVVVAEEQARELYNVVAQGSVLRARDIEMIALNNNGNEVSRIKRADRLRVNFVVAANDITEPGNVRLFLRIITPDGFVLSTEDNPTIEFEGQNLAYSASRTVDYRNDDLPVSIFYDSAGGYIAGTYRIELYANGAIMGYGDVEMK